MKLKVTVDGKTYEVDVEVADEPQPAPASYVTQPAPVRVPASGAPPPPPTTVGDDKVCRSPISGIVVKVNAQTGQAIQPGDILIVLEAMKMETNITAPMSGKVSAVKVNVGDNVQSGQVVVECE